MNESKLKLMEKLAVDIPEELGYGALGGAGTIAGTKLMRSLGLQRGAMPTGAAASISMIELIRQLLEDSENE